MELADFRIGSCSVCSKFKHLEDSFEWVLIGVYRPNDDYFGVLYLRSCRFLCLLKTAHGV